MWAGAAGGVQAATRPTGGTWSAPHPLSDGAGVPPPEIAVDDSGCFYVVWIEDTAVQLSTLCPFGPWSSPIPISGDVEVSELGGLDVAAAGTGGRAGAVWVTPGLVVYGVVGAASAGGWETPVALSDNTLWALHPSIGFDAALNATAIWTQGAPPLADESIESSVHPPGGDWSAAATISGDSPVRNPTLAVSASGAATAAWELDTATGSVIQAASRSNAGTWGEPEDLSDPLQSAFTPRAAAGADGVAAVIWNQESGLESHSQVAHRPAGGPWSEVADLSDQAAGGSFAEAVVVADDGSITAIWALDPPDPPGVVQAAHLAPGGSWTTPVDVSNPTHDTDWPSLAVDVQGNVTAAFVALTGSDFHVEAATLDTTGPTIDAFNVPATGAAGKELSYFASATDVWSPVASYAWKFGDGASADTPAPSHSYIAPGTYTVSLTVTDTVGNKTTRTATTTVSEASAPPPPPVSQQPPAITLFELKDPKIQGLSRVVDGTPAKTKLKVRLTRAADVRIVLRSKHRHLVDGKQKRIKVTLTRRLPAGRSSITMKGRLATITLLPDTYRIVGTATNSAGTSPARRARLVVVRPSSVSRIGDPR